MLIILGLVKYVYSKHKGTEVNGKTGLHISSDKATAIHCAALSCSSNASNTLPKIYLKEYNELGI